MCYIMLLCVCIYIYIYIYTYIHQITDPVPSGQPPELRPQDAQGPVCLSPSPTSKL